jgi:glycosyltransferase involved in cell wall biosynthesis
MGYLCKYLRREGWEPTVVTEALEDDTFAFLASVCPVRRVAFHTLKNPWLARLQWLAVFVLDFLAGYKDYRIYREACRLLCGGGFDAIVCSTYRDFPLTAARRAARKYHLPFIADIRDVIEQYAGDEFISRPVPFGLHKLLTPTFRRRSLSRRNRALREAACITTVSPWHVELLRHYNPSVELIYNGYDPEVFFPVRTVAEQFIITYTGRLLSTAMRDPGLLFEALSMLSRQGDFPPHVCRVHWYVDEASKEKIAALAAQAGVADYMDYMGYVPASEIPTVLNGSSVLLLLTNKSSSSGPKGVMTTKLFESFAVEKPILCIRSDESHLAALLAASQAGLAAREAGEVSAFLRYYYVQWKEKGYTTPTPPLNRDMTQAFSRREQAAQFMHLLDRLL